MYARGVISRVQRSLSCYYLTLYFRPDPCPDLGVSKFDDFPRCALFKQELALRLSV